MKITTIVVELGKTPEADFTQLDDFCCKSFFETFISLFEAKSLLV